MISKPIKCCNLTQLCATIAQFHHDRLKASGQNNEKDYFSFGAIDTIWNLYVNLWDNQALCEWCLKFTDQLVKFGNDLAKGSEEKLCEFCGRTILGLANEFQKEHNSKDISPDRYCCTKKKYIIDDSKIIFASK